MGGLGYTLLVCLYVVLGHFYDKVYVHTFWYIKFTFTFSKKKKELSGGRRSVVHLSGSGGRREVRLADPELKGWPLLVRFITFGIPATGRCLRGMRRWKRRRYLGSSYMCIGCYSLYFHRILWSCDPFIGLHVLTLCIIFDSLLYRLGAVYSVRLAQPLVCCSGRTVLPGMCPQFCPEQQLLMLIRSARFPVLVDWWLCTSRLERLLVDYIAGHGRLTLIQSRAQLSGDCVSRLDFGTSRL